MPMPPFSGLIAAPHTPMHPDGQINLDAIDGQAALLQSQGVIGAFICGTTGEGASLTSAERQQIAERWADVRGKQKLIVHVGHNSQREACALAAHAHRLGVHGIAACGPTFFKPADVDALLAYCAPIAAAAPDVSFFYYHIPGMTGIHLSMAAFLREGADQIPTLAGLKYAHPDLMEVQQCLAVRGGRFQVLFGVDEMLLGALAVGVTGAVGSTYNYGAATYHRMNAAFAAGDLATARACARDAVELVALLHEGGGVQVGKAIMRLRGVDCGPVRAPLRPLTEAQLAALYPRIQALGMFADTPLTLPPSGSAP